MTIYCPEGCTAALALPNQQEGIGDNVRLDQYWMPTGHIQLRCVEADSITVRLERQTQRSIISR